ncbi:hypothetical protein ACIA5G_33540 [Amycolatopsis sp. NPDC051758]|uniref:hypothetical protein n=1 Tax=Amycolatopsis sp. NPDC051758 TaxID=3363935 RepID=UPI003787F6B1
MPLSPAGERLHSKVAAYLKSSDPAMLADAQTVQDTVEVARTVTSRFRDRPPNYRDAHAAGLLHWLRADHVDTAAAAVERGRASAYFLLLLRRHRGAIPDSALAEVAGMAARHAGKRDGVPSGARSRNRHSRRSTSKATTPRCTARPCCCGSSSRPWIRQTPRIACTWRP